MHIHSDTSTTFLSTGFGIEIVTGDVYIVLSDLARKP